MEQAIKNALQLASSFLVLGLGLLALAADIQKESTLHL